MKKQLDLLFLVDSGIGNAIQSLYSVEYALDLGLKVGIHLGNISGSFQDYLQASYGEELIVRELTKELSVKHLIHTFTFQQPFDIDYEHYIYVNADYHSSKEQSETEQQLSIVQALYPGGQPASVLKRLIAQAPDQDGLEGKIVLYPGSSRLNPVKRWPYFEALIDRLGEEKVLIIGGPDDLDFHLSYYYPKWLSGILPQQFLNQPKLWKAMKSMGLLKKHADQSALARKPQAYFNAFRWEELAYIFQKATHFIGNDGGLMHFAGAVGAKGVGIFGPTSVAKNKCFNNQIKPLQLSYDCQPCQFGVGGVQLSPGHINCPHQIRCLYNISVDQILDTLN